MRTQIIAICLVLAVTGLDATSAQSHLSEPDAIVYGTVTIDGQHMKAGEGVTISARLVYDANDPNVLTPTSDRETEYELASYRLGDDANAGDRYVLRIPLAWQTSRAELVFAADVPYRNDGEDLAWSKLAVEDRTIRFYVQDHAWAVAQQAYRTTGDMRYELAAIALGDRGMLVPMMLDLSLDSDQDQLYDRQELAWGLDPNSSDTDNDGLSDYDEVNYDPNPHNQYDPYDPLTGRGTDLNADSNDTDLDGMTDADEWKWGLLAIYPNRYEDLDRDGYLNWEEVARGTDPNDPDATPARSFIFVSAGAHYDPNTVMADGTQASPFATIQEGLDHAISNDEVVLMDGLYTGPGNVDVEVLYKGIMIAADSNESGPDHCVIDCNALGRGFLVLCDHNDTDVVIRGLTIKNGFAPNGGAICCSGGMLTVQNCLLVHNYAESDGGALFFTEGALPNVVNATVADNTAAGRGGGIYCERGCMATVVNAILWNNAASAGGNDVHLATAAVWCPEDASQMLISYSDLLADEDSVYEGQLCDFNDVQYTNLREDPLFARRAYGYWYDNSTMIPQDDVWVWVDGDYHLRSPAGRWDPSDPNGSIWTTKDDLTSPCIDAGDPDSPVAEESVPHGSRVNMGAYGGTEKASRSIGASGDETESSNSNAL